MPTNGQNSNNAYLDNVRKRYGPEGLRNIFHDTTNRDLEKAVNLVNDNRMEYPSLFALRPEITKVGLYPRLNGRNRHAYDLSENMLNGNLDTLRQRRENDRNTLSWMLRSGYRTDGMNDPYDQVMDTTALLLAKVHKDKVCLKPIEHMIFQRNRRGLYTYDLIWAFFEASGPDDLQLLAERLNSPDPRDNELARSLLNFVPCIENTANQRDQYRCATRWLRANKDRLYYTGESNQQRTNPKRYALKATISRRTHHD